MQCAMEPFVLLAEQTSCAESPPCTHILCFSHIRCLLASTVSVVITGCRTPEKQLFCVCPPTSSFPELIRLTNRVPLSTANYQIQPLTSLLDSPFLKYRPIMSNNSSSLLLSAESTQASTPSSSNNHTVVAVVCAVIAALIAIALIALLVLRYMRNHRRNHGEYRPQFEEQNHAKDLPYLSPVAVEGLI